MAEIIFCQINRKIEGILEVFLDFSVQYDGKLAGQMRARELNQCFPKENEEECPCESRGCGFFRKENEYEHER